MHRISGPGASPVSEGCERGQSRGDGATAVNLWEDRAPPRRHWDVKKTNQPPHFARGFPTRLSVRARKGGVPSCSSLGLRPHSASRVGTRLTVPFCSWGVAHAQGWDSQAGQGPKKALSRWPWHHRTDDFDHSCWSVRTRLSFPLGWPWAPAHVGPVPRGQVYGFCCQDLRAMLHWAVSDDRSASSVRAVPSQVPAPGDGTAFVWKGHCPRPQMCPVEQSAGVSGSPLHGPRSHRRESRQSPSVG